MGETVNLVQLFTILKKRWKIIVLLTLTATILSAAVTHYVLVPAYQGTTLILVNQKTSENQIDLSQVSDNVELINTYSVIIKSPVILKKVIEDQNLSQSVEQLNQKITITSQEDSQVFSLTVEDSNPETAVKIANSVSTTFQREIPGIMKVDNVSILAEAELKENPVPVSPNLLFNLVAGFVVGALAGVGIAMLIEMLDNTLNNDQDVAACLGLPVLGSVQKVSAKDSSSDALAKKVRGETLES
ncbi:capsular biosynthesis protein [Mesobacillus campisalis]|uniref:Capsular biosynthesis protein n=1 Tax=Mesobacillus campisalis TaxID=1408103 RepID=A0A0M2SVG6_9BACI|nr:Wzz/FepE/Etk N-terminal domain-containing protein [Mesobacillus campisalis]KKK36625.1 capsular biosynthesis protein [Mesobacillus campisalis]